MGGYQTPGQHPYPRSGEQSSSGTAKQRGASGHSARPHGLESLWQRRGRVVGHPASVPPNRPATDRRATTGRTWPRPALGGRPALQPTVPPNRRQRRRPNHRRSPRLSPHGTCWTACGRRRPRRVPPLEATRVGHRRCRRLTGRRVSDPLLMVELLVGGQRRPAAKRKAPSRPPSQASSSGNDQRSAPERHDLRRALATGVCLPHALHKKQTVTQPTLRSATLRTFAWTWVSVAPSHRPPLQTGATAGACVLSRAGRGGAACWNHPP